MLVHRLPGLALRPHAGPMGASRAQGNPQLWEGGWAEQMGRSPADPNDTGYGYTPEQLQQFVVPPLPMMLEYAEAVRARADVYLASLDDADFQEITVVNPGAGPLIWPRCASNWSGSSISTAARSPTCADATGAGRLIVQRRTAGRAGGQGGRKCLIRGCCCWSR